MRHLVKGRKLKRTNSHKRALLRNLATALITHKRIATTEAKAKELRPYIEKLITRAKKAYVKQSQNLLPEGQSMDVHSRRMASADLFGKGAIQELFEVIAPKVINRPGGYCRIIKTGVRTGDAARTAIIQLVDWFDTQDGANSSKKKKKTTKPKTKVDEHKAKTSEHHTTQVEDKKVKEKPQINNNEPVEDKNIEAETIAPTTSEEPISNGEEIIPSDEAEDVNIKKKDE